MKKPSRQKLHLLLVSSYFNVFAFSLFGPLYAIYVLRIGASTLQISQALALYSLTLGFCLLLFGRLQNRIHKKAGIVVSGFFLLIPGAFGYLFIHSMMIAYVLQVWNAMSTAWVMPAFKTLYGKSEDRGRETEEWAWFDGGSQLLVATATFMGGLIVTYAGFRTLIMVVGFLQLFGALYSTQLLLKKRV